MGRVITSVRISNPSDLSSELLCDALVDTGAALMVLPKAWRPRLGELAMAQAVEFETATQEMIQAEVCGPVRIQIEGFRPIFSEVAFVDMRPEGGVYEPLIGYIILEQSMAAVDLVSHRLMHVKRLDLK